LALRSNHRASGLAPHAVPRPSSPTSPSPPPAGRPPARPPPPHRPDTAADHVLYPGKGGYGAQTPRDGASYRVPDDTGAAAEDQLRRAHPVASEFEIQANSISGVKSDKAKNQ